MFSHLLQVRRLPHALPALVLVFMLGVWAGFGCMSNPTPHPYTADVVRSDDVHPGTVDPSAGQAAEDDDGAGDQPAANLDGSDQDAVAGAVPDVVDDVLEDGVADGDALDDNSTFDAGPGTLPGRASSVGDKDPYP